MRRLRLALVLATAALATSVVGAPVLATFGPPPVATLSFGTARHGMAQQGRPRLGSRGVRRTTTEIEAADRAAGPSQRLVLPFRTNPRRMSLPGGRAARATRWSARAGGSRALRSMALTSTALTLGLNFNGVTGPTETGAFPPDTMGAVGPSQYIVAVNGRFRSFGKETGVADGVLDVSSDTFFAPVMTPVDGTTIIGNFTSDPHIRYDRLSQRWIIVMIDVPFTVASPSFTTAPNRVMVARSDGSVITNSTAWTFFSFPGDATNFADYPTLGVDANALYIGANMFTNAGSFTGTKMYVVRKSSILGAGPLEFTPFAGATSSTGAGPYTPQGVDNFDPVATTGYFIGVDNTMSIPSQLDLRRVTDPAGTPTLSSDQMLTVPTTVWPIDVPHLGNTGSGSNPGLLDGLDDRLFAAQLRGGHLWTAHNIQVDTTGAASNSGGRNGSRWYEIDVTGGPSLVQSGTMFDPAAVNPNSYWIPSVAVSGQNIMAIGGSVAGNNHRADAWFSGRLPSAPPGQLDAPTEYTASSTAYNPPGNPGGTRGRRWGDYSFTSVDPDDDMTMWTIQEYNNGTDTYGTRVARLRAPPPATPSSTTPASVAPGQASTSVAVTGTSVVGSGFFDPGSGFPKHLRAAVGCGITVNSATYVNPTSVQLDLNTTAATGGPCDVTITNPDDQTATGTGILAILPPLAPPTASNAFTTTRAKVKVTKKRIILTTRVTVPGAGRIAQRATTKKGRKTTTRCLAKRTAPKAATYTLTCTMSRAARAQLRRSGMRVSLRTTFTPTGGTAASRSQRVVLRRHRR